MTTSGALQSDADAYIEWINSFTLPYEVQDLNALNDGQIFWHILHDIDEISFAGELPKQEQSQTARRNNLQYVLIRMQEFLQEHRRGYKPCTQEDLDLMAANGSFIPYMKMLHNVVLVMLESPKLQFLLERTQDLSEPTVQIIGQLLQDVSGYNADTLDEEMDSSGNDTTSSFDQAAGAPSAPSDPRAEIFQLEEQYAKIVAQLHRRDREYGNLESEHNALSASLARSQETNDALTSQIIEKDEQLRKMTTVISQREQSSVRELDLKISQQEEVIGAQETELASSRTALAELQRESKRLSAVSERLQRLQDDHDAMKIELDKQTRKANKADKYMQKIQASQAIERERDAIRLELDDARRKASAANKMRLENTDLQRTNDEVSRTLSQIEREYEELRVTNRQLRIACDSYERQIESLHERNAQDQETIANLRESARENDVAGSPLENGALESELSEYSNTSRDMKNQIAVLERENRQLLDNIEEQKVTLEPLTRRLEAAETSYKEQHAQLQRARDEIIVLQTSLTQVQQGHPIEGTKVFKRMREQCENGEEGRLKLGEELQASHEKIKTLMSERKELLLNCDTLQRLSTELLLGELVDKGKLEMLEAVKRQCSAELVTLSVDHENLKERHRVLQVAHERYVAEHQLNNHGTTEQIDGLSEEQAKSLSSALASTENDVSHENAAGYAIDDTRRLTIEELQAQNQARSEQVNRLKTEVARLEQSCKILDADSKTKDHEVFQNLERENKLLTTAFYDLASRLQWNNVTLQRRTEPPQNWLGRQRARLSGPVGIAR